MINILGLVLAERKKLDEAQFALHEANFLATDDSTKAQVILESIEAIVIVSERLLVAIADLIDLEVALIKV